MFTFHHGFWMYFVTRHQARVWQFVLGSMLPDYIYFVFIVFLLLSGVFHWSDLLTLSPTVMISLLPLYPWVVKIDLIGHSVISWGVAMGLTLVPRLRMLQAFVIGWGSHLLIDELTHAARANYYLYPLSWSMVHSPVSYWEPDYFAEEFKIINGTLMVLAALYLLYEYVKKRKRI